MDMIDEEIKRIFERLADPDISDKDRNTEYAHLTVLYSRVSEETKASSDRYKADKDSATRLAEADAVRETERRKNRTMLITSILDNTVKIGIFVGSVLFYGAQLAAGYRFEENGYVSSATFKDFMKSARPKI